MRGILQNSLAAKMILGNHVGVKVRVRIGMDTRVRSTISFSEQTAPPSLREGSPPDQVGDFPISTPAEKSASTNEIHLSPQLDYNSTLVTDSYCPSQS